MHKAEPGTQRLPVATILTLPAAGSEESDSCVISDETLHIKGGFGSPLMRPVFSILNPELTYTLPPYQTACGCMDIMAHAMERYFSQTKHVEVTDRMGEAMMKVIIHNLPLALADPCNEAARSEIMLAGTWAQNDMTGTGREQDWFNHGLEHQISGFLRHRPRRGPGHLVPRLDAVCEHAQRMCGQARPVRRARVGRGDEL